MQRWCVEQRWNHRENCDLHFAFGCSDLQILNPLSLSTRTSEALSGNSFLSRQATYEKSVTRHDSTRHDSGMSGCRKPQELSAYLRFKEHNTEYDLKQFLLQLSGDKSRHSKILHQTAVFNHRDLSRNVNHTNSRKWIVRQRITGEVNPP